ncbi:uncharacterized protein LOC126872071 isoform X2 [Bombus huntii]|uniref:uncharacterized protein LOC126872071 isoform X2 n=1 Tax=Bombus huntii TaxID=85661 RepID=UPI0021AA6F60|nr:uncharacterized protein LOC126872071 isoform X2 [Bombus huntii]
MVQSDIKERLEAYRRRKRREEMIESIKNVIKTVLPWNGNKSAEDSSVAAPLKSDIKDDQDAESTCSDDSVDQSQCTMLRIVTYLLYFLLWDQKSRVNLVPILYLIQTAKLSKEHLMLLSLREK